MQRQNQTSALISMGNSVTCFAPKKNLASSIFSRNSSSVSWNKASKKNRQQSEEEAAADALIREQALEALMLFKQHQKDGGGSPAIPPFTKSASVKYPPAAASNYNSRKTSKENYKFGRSSSTSRQLFHSTDFSSLQQEHPPALDLTKKLEIDGAEKEHFVLVHGGGFGAWCWYKTITLLTQSGFTVDALDLTASGVHPSHTTSVHSISEYMEPLTNLLHNLDHAHKVILVGHDIGGACISYAMELFPSKIVKSIFVAAPMPKNGQSILDIFSHEEGPSELMKQAQKFVYGNGKDEPPTAVNLDKQYLKDLLFNQTPAKDVALASVSMRSIPFAPILEKLCLTEANYGSVRRFYVETLEDRAVPVLFQEYIVNSNPPEKVLQLKGADHAPFLSKPQALHKLLLEIAKLPLPAN